MAEEEKTEIIKKAKDLPAPERFSLAPRTFDEAFRFAEYISRSDLVPKDFRGNPANVLIAVQLAMELGLTPMQGLQSIYVVNGRPALFGDALPALVLASGLLEAIEETGDDKNASCTVKRKGLAAITRTYSIAEAAKVPYKEFDKWITLAEKSTYKAYPKRMLQMRARTYAFRDAFADVLKGVAIKEEIEDSIDVTPPEPIKTPQPTRDGLSIAIEAQGDKLAQVQPLENKADGPKEMPAAVERKTADRIGDSKADRQPRRQQPASGQDGKPVSDPIPENPAEQGLSKEQKALLKIDSYERETWPEGSALSDLIRGLDQDAQVRVCKHWTARQKEVHG